MPKGVTCNYFTLLLKTIYSYFQFRQYVKLASMITDKPKEQEKKLTNMMIVIVAVFIICNLVDNIYQILRGTGSIKWKEENQNVYPIACVLTVLSSSINFLVYGFFNPKFRTVLSSIFWTKAPQQQEYKTIQFLSKTRANESQLTIH